MTSGTSRSSHAERHVHFALVALVPVVDARRISMSADVREPLMLYGVSS